MLVLTIFLLTETCIFLYLTPYSNKPACLIFLSNMNFPRCVKRLAYYLDILIGFLNNGFVPT